MTIPSGSKRAFVGLWFAVGFVGCKEATLPDTVGSNLVQACRVERRQLSNALLGDIELCAPRDGLDLNNGQQLVARMVGEAAVDADLYIKRLNTNSDPRLDSSWTEVPGARSVTPRTSKEAVDATGGSTGFAAGRYRACARRGAGARKKTGGIFLTLDIATSGCGDKRDTCFGAVGKNCALALPGCEKGSVGDFECRLTPDGTCLERDDGLMDCLVSVGSQMHDSCCSNNRSGFNCGDKIADKACIDPSKRTETCGPEWCHASRDFEAWARARLAWLLGQAFGIPLRTNPPNVQQWRALFNPTEIAYEGTTIAQTIPSASSIPSADPVCDLLSQPLKAPPGTVIRKEDAAHDWCEYSSNSTLLDWATCPTLSPSSIPTPPSCPKSDPNSADGGRPDAQVFAHGWQDRTPSPLPTSWPQPRRDHGIAFDSVRNRTLVFGGAAATHPLSDVWEWDGGTGIWLERQRPAGPVQWPTQVSWPGVAYDPLRHKLVVFGGLGPPPTTLPQDTWEFDIDSGVWARWPIDVIPANWPAGRQQHAMTYDSIRQRVVMFGGSDGGANVYQDVWEWDGSSGNWTNRTPATLPSSWPNGRTCHAMTTDIGSGRMLLFGGFGDGTQRDLWEWDGSSGNWTNRTPATLPADWPAARGCHSFVYNRMQDTAVLYGGGLTFNNFNYDDLWTLDTASNVWTNRTLAPRPSLWPEARQQHAAAWDTGRGKLVVFAGMVAPTVDGLLQDLWEWTP
jgi:hypothetical protein